MPEDGLKPMPWYAWFGLLAAVVVAAALLIWFPLWDQGDRTGVAWFLASSYSLLVAGLILIWNLGIPNGNGKNVDLEQLARDRLKATVAVAMMVALLAVVSLIAHTVVIASKAESKDTPEKKNSPEASCCRNVAVCGMTPPTPLSCYCAHAPTPCAEAGSAR